MTIDANLNYVPELAESWEVKDDGKTYIFHCARVKFHDGTDFDAAAVQFNFLHITGRLDPEEKPFAAPFFTAVESVEPFDTHTVQFNQVPELYGYPGVSDISGGLSADVSHSYKTHGKKDVALHPAGTGPFTLAKWEQNNVIVLEKNPNYFKPGLPYLDRLEFKIMKEG